MSVTKECRPKSALRRKAVQLDRQHPQQDLDLTEGEMEQFLEVEQYSSTMTTNRIQSKTEVNQGNSKSKIWFPFSWYVMWWFDQSRRRSFLSESRYTQTFNVFHVSSSISCGTSFEGYCWDNESSKVIWKMGKGIMHTLCAFQKKCMETALKK